MGFVWSGRGGPISVAILVLVALFAGILGRRSRRLRILAGVVLLSAFGFAATGCGGNSNSVSNPPKGTYTLTLTGTDSSSATIPAATTTITLTID
jgi:disulfide bond formation protein DsbB